ncbi:MULTISPECIES: ferredoxin [unclassified Micromonospora]|uniref:ferredoxin n=1 Tax=unclassified Micromonospora TaxID=2617518 RepID=UPI002DD89977|nr:ferredoxin [Micromonospora sp. NBC_01813]WSA09165.1 ferredoxin family protein [Micromonospora sp. NBC_01813]
MTYVVTDECVDVQDRSCVEECPVDCIYEGDRMMYINPDECVDCGRCEPVCPVTSIFHLDDLPGSQAHFGPINAEFFGEIGTPGGARKIGRVGHDHPAVAGSGS